uniref:Reverse transcriptase domain-containing protein n=1 Tax=Tanacetum cinerariifolium TaxID=118510 RepID=A0A6L2MTR0_TANCI|nr:hypothetical protein [Tanacetum cinerariifolium]
MLCQIVQKKREEKRIEEEQAAKAQNWKLPVCYDDDDDEESSNSLEDNIISELPPYSAITPNEPVDYLSMGDEHLNTIPATESDEFIKSCVENLVPNPNCCTITHLLVHRKKLFLTILMLILNLSPYPIPNKDSDSNMEKIDLPFTPDDPMPPSIEDDDHDSERDIPILEELLDNYSLSLPDNESYHFDIPSPYRPPAKPPDGNFEYQNDG